MHDSRRFCYNLGAAIAGNYPAPRPHLTGGEAWPLYRTPSRAQSAASSSRLPTSPSAPRIETGCNAGAVNASPAIGVTPIRAPVPTTLRVMVSNRAIAAGAPCLSRCSTSRQRSPTACRRCARNARRGTSPNGLQMVTGNRAIGPTTWPPWPERGMPPTPCTVHAGANSTGLHTRCMERSGIGEISPTRAARSGTSKWYGRRDSGARQALVRGWHSTPAGRTTAGVAGCAAKKRRQWITSSPLRAVAPIGPRIFGLPALHATLARGTATGGNSSASNDALARRRQP